MDSLKVRPYPVSIGRMGEIKLLVRREDLDKATELLKTIKDNNPEEN
jgi:hypothetical protein